MFSPVFLTSGFIIPVMLFWYRSLILTYKNLTLTSNAKSLEEFRALVGFKDPTSGILHSATDLFSLSLSPDKLISSDMLMVHSVLPTFVQLRFNRLEYYKIKH